MNAKIDHANLDIRKCGRSFWYGRTGLLCIMTFILIASSTASAQSERRPLRIGVLSTSPLSAVGVRLAGFQQGLREIGYVEGKNVVIEFRSTEGQLSRASDLAAELVRLPVDVIVTTGGTSTRPAKENNLYDSDRHGSGC